MNKAKSILLTTKSAKDGTHFAITELEKALAQSAVSGIASCLGHDSAKPIAWTIPYALYLEPGSTRLAGKTLMPETTEEQVMINELHQQAIMARTIADFEPYREVFEKELEGKLSTDYKILSSTFVACYDPGILERCYPALMAEVDKDGLLYIQDLLSAFDYLGQGVFADKKTGFAICAHPYFRRSLFRQNNLNYYFLDELLKREGRPDLTLRLRLDGDLIGIAGTFVPAMEYEYWRGPHFDEDVANIKLGVAAYGMDDYNKLVNGIGRTEFWWKMEGGEQTFEAEEVKEVPALGISQDDYGCRYAHSIYDAEQGVFEHFDGAIRMYDSYMIMDRWDKDIKSAGKSSVYTKLWRVDGKLPLSDWKLLLHHYFQGNHLIGEYLGGPDYQAEQETEFADETVKPVLETLVPVKMENEDGIRIAVSYLPREHHPDHEFYLEGHDTFDSKQLQKVVEFDVIELKKGLMRAGHDLLIPADYQFIDCYDGLQWNIPEIATTKENTALLFKVLAEVLTAKNFPEQTIAFTCSWSADQDQKVVLSLLGSSVSLRRWLAQFPGVPAEPDAFVNWLQSQENWLAAFSEKSDEPRLTDVLCDDGTLFLKREPVFKYAVPGTVQFEGNKFEMVLKAEYEELSKLVESKDIGYIATMHVKKVFCKKCGQDYMTCPHSDGTDIKDFQIIGYYWVDARA